MTEQFSVLPTAASDEPSSEPIATAASAPTFEPITDLPLPTQKEMRRAYSRCGWAVFIPFVVCAVIFPLLVATVSFFSATVRETVYVLFPNATIDILGTIQPFAEFLGDCVLALFNSTLFYTNELFIGLSLLLGATVIFSLPKTRPERRQVSPKLFFFLFLVTLFFSIVASFTGGLWEFLLNGTISTAFPTELPSEEISILALFSQIGPWQYLLCVGILAPIIEELFFRKLLIDRLYRYGELGAILFSSVCFALFHQNVPQYFYTLLGGLLFGYLYCKTGSTLLVILLHMVFNIFSGVIPTVISYVLTNILSVMALIDTPTAKDSILSILERVGEPFPQIGAAFIEILPILALLVIAVVAIVLLVYSVIRLLLGITGGALFFVYTKNAKIEEGCKHLSLSQKASAMLFNTGVIAAGVIAVIFLVQSLI